MENSETRQVTKTVRAPSGADLTSIIHPFPGLRPFGVEESHLFFGREAHSLDVINKLCSNHFVAVLGTSGSGKSSFVYCGLIPTLYGGLMQEIGSKWKIVILRPGVSPIDNLAEGILFRNRSYHELSAEDRMIKKSITATVLRSSSLGLLEVVKQFKGPGEENVLVIIDQFEELFRFSKLETVYSDRNEAGDFVNLLLGAAQQEEEPIYVALTMRSDFIGDCAKYPDLTQAINDSHYLIPQMTREEKRLAIEGPVAVGGGKIAPRLTQQLLNDLGDNPDHLPILQHALMRTWNNWSLKRKPSEPMDLQHYNAIGTLRQALSMHANEAYDALTRREKQICETTFKALTESGGEGKGIRRPTKLKTIADIAGVTEDEVENVVNKFREPGRSLLMPPHGVSLTSDTVIDISHESLMRIWDKLKQWLEEESQSVSMYLKISEAAERFQQGKSMLWKMPDLQLALNWRMENRPTLVWGQRYHEAFERTMVFLESSEKAYLTEQRNKELLQRRKVRAVRMTALFLGLASMICLFFVVYANVQKDYANEAKSNAENAQLEAEKLRDDAVSLTNQAEKAAREATDAKNQADKERADAVVARQDALASAEEARRQTEIAREQTILAEQATEDANKNLILAEERQRQTEVARQQATAQEERARSLRYLSIAQSMAIKAREVFDPQLKGLVAKQAYDFYTEHKDESTNYNGDIFSGVYYGLKELYTEGVRLDSAGIDPNIASALGARKLNQYHGHIEDEGDIGVRSLAINREGTTIYSAGGDGRVLRWNVENRKFQELFASPDQVVIRKIELTEDEKFLACGTTESALFLVDASGWGDDHVEIQLHDGALLNFVMVPGSGDIISVGTDRKVVRYSGSEELSIVGELKSQANALALSPDGNTLAIGFQDGEIELWDLNNPQKEHTRVFRREEKRNPVEAIAFSHNGRYLAIGGRYRSNLRGYIVIWDLVSKEVFGPDLSGFASSVTEVKFSEDGLLVAGGSRDGTVRFWDMENIFDLPTTLDDHGDWVWDFVFHPSGDAVMTASKDGLVRHFLTQPETYVSEFCDYLQRNMSEIEWRQFVAEPSDIAWIETCDGKAQPSDSI